MAEMRDRGRRFGGSTTSHSRRAIWAVILTACSGADSPREQVVLTLGPDGPVVPAELAPQAETVEAPVDLAGAAEVSVDDLLAWADEHAPDLQLAQAQRLRGEAALEAASPAFPDNPELSAAAGGRTIAGETFFEMEAGLSQRFEIGGERGLRREAAERTIERIESEVARSRWEVQAEIRALFGEGLLARSRVAAAETEIGFAEEVLEVARRRVEAGEDSGLVLLLAESELSQARGRLVDEQAHQVTVRLTLAEVVGWPDSELPPLSGELPPVRRAQSTDVLVELAAEYQPALRVAAFSIAEAEARLRLEEREATPEPTFGVSYGHEEEPDAAVNIWLVTAALPLPLWQTNQEGRAAAEAELRIAEAEARVLLASWRSRLGRAAAAVNAAAAGAELYGADVLPAAEQNLALIRRAYELGELDLQAVSQTRERVLDLQIQGLEALGEYVRALSQLEALVGPNLDAALEAIP